jgi:hypothetical protein
MKNAAGAPVALAALLITAARFVAAAAQVSKTAVTVATGLPDFLCQ